MRTYLPTALFPVLLLLTACEPEPVALPSCDGHACVANAHCILNPEPACVCDEGFEYEDGSCVPGPGSLPDPAIRTAETMCAEWQKGHVITAPKPFTPGGSQCDPGTLARGAIDDTVLRVNFFRWLIGLGPVVDDAVLNERSQKCSVVTAFNPPRSGYDPHHPTANVTCFNAEGAAGAGQSNLAWGSGHPADAVDQFLEDKGSEATMGHRRWIMYPPLGPIGVGYFLGGGTPYRDGHCLHVFNHKGGGDRPDWYALPPAGPVPLEVTKWPWTFHAANMRAGSMTVEIERQSDKKVLGVSLRALPNNYGDPAIFFTPNGWTPQAGETYRVTVTGLSEPVSYEVSPVACK